MNITEKKAEENIAFKRLKLVLVEVIVDNNTSSKSPKIYYFSLFD